MRTMRLYVASSRVSRVEGGRANPVSPEQEGTYGDSVRSRDGRLSAAIGAPIGQLRQRISGVR